MTDTIDQVPADRPDPEALLSRARCACCRRAPLGAPINLIGLDDLALWEYPTIGNVMTGDSGRAVALLCRGCLESGCTPREAIEIREGSSVVYHSIASLRPQGSA